MRKILLYLALAFVLLLFAPSVSATGVDYTLPIHSGPPTTLSESAIDTRIADIPYSVTLNKSSASVVENGQLTLTATPTPSYATVTWTSSNTTAATVNSQA